MPSYSKVPRSAAGQAVPQHLPCSAWHWCYLCFLAEGWFWVGPVPVSRELPQTGCAWLGVPGDDVLETPAWLCAAVWCWGCTRAVHCGNQHARHATVHKDTFTKEVCYMDGGMETRQQLLCDSILILCWVHLFVIQGLYLLLV